MSNHPELEMAIDEIVNEAITYTLDNRVVDINLDKLKTTESIKKKISEEFAVTLSYQWWESVEDGVV